MRLFLCYLRERRRLILLLLTFGVVFAVTFALYRLPLGAVAYPLLLCGALGLLGAILDFLRVRRKHQTLQELQRRTAAMLEELPGEAGLLDQDYWELVQSVREELIQLETGMTARYQDMMDYYGVWVHQIKTPIASMRLTLQGEDSPLARRLLGDLFRIEQYVDMVLTYLRLDSDSSDYVFREQDVDWMIRQTVKKFSREFIERRIALQYQPVNRTIVTDEKWFTFVLEQLLSNALKYTREGYVKISLHGENTLCVEDSGIGIAPEDLPRIFEKGYTGYNGRADKRASGLGLYLCKRICGNLGLELQAHSEVGRGTTMGLTWSERDPFLTKT